MNEDAPAKVVAVAGANGYDAAVLAVAVPVNEIHMTSVVSRLRTVKPCSVVCAVKALCAVPPVEMEPEQSVRLTLAGSWPELITTPLVVPGVV